MSNNSKQETLMHKLLQYISENNPNLLMQLEEDEEVTTYLSGKLAGVSSILNLSEQPEYLIEQTCMEVMTQDLRPSKFNYVCNILEEEFEATFWRLKKSGTLKYEVINIMAYSQPLFEAMHYSEASQDNRLLHYAIAGAIAEYFDKDMRGNETVSHELQQPA